MLIIGLVVVANLAFVYVGGARWIDEQFFTPTEQSVITDPVLVDVFIFTLEEEVQKKRAQPEEGYQPHMFLDVFPGLTATDFEGVEASVGYYTFVDGKLVHELGDATLVHETPEALSRRGMETLLINIATRTSINLQSTGTITDIIRAITRSE
jgi:hypothetical protein